jgi:hypothetical protein
VMLCVGGKTRGAVRACLDFWAPPFASRQKVENIQLHEGLKKFRKLSEKVPDQAQHDSKE